MAVITGGASSAPSVSAHGGCERFRGTDSLVTGTPRRTLAAQLGYPDEGGTIPAARWVRAMTFERIVQAQPLTTQFVSKAVGAAGFPRPTAVVSANASASHTGGPADPIESTRQELIKARDRAVASGQATLVHTLTLPFPRIEDGTAIRPDFALVARSESGHAELVVGDVKDYERVRSRIDDKRMMKGFLQVALGAEAASQWTRLPDDLHVSDWGVLAVPKNAFLQPEPKLENLTDYRQEVLDRIEERLESVEAYDAPAALGLEEHTKHLTATFNPTTCTTCTLFRFCRAQLRQDPSPESLLIRLGVPELQRPALVPFVEGTAPPLDAPESLLNSIRATMTGRALLTGQKRTDNVGEAGTVNVVLLKSDGSALGVHGVAIRRMPTHGESEWDVQVFSDPMASTTRTKLMNVLGKHLNAAMRDLQAENQDAPRPVHVVVPDEATADLLVSIADGLAGVELSRLRWQRDLDEGRPALTFDGEPAVLPRRLPPFARLSVSFLLDADRGRALTLRSSIQNAQAAMAQCVVAGGPALNSLRLDYLVRWAQTIGGSPCVPDAVEDDIERKRKTPGARMTSAVSDDIFELEQLLKRGESVEGSYETAVRAALAYKQKTLDAAIECLATLPSSSARELYRALEGDAQAVWRRRYNFKASDLVRFGRVYDSWRDAQVAQIDADNRCASQLRALSNPQAAADTARDAGNRDLVFAVVTKTAPLTAWTKSRNFEPNDRLVLLHLNAEPLLDRECVTVKHQKGSFRLEGMPVAGVLKVSDPGTAGGSELELDFLTPPLGQFAVGDELVLARRKFFGDEKKSLKQHNVTRPRADTRFAPTDHCTPESYANEPQLHYWCCRPHEAAEAEFSDDLYKKRLAGQLNPQVWPPALDQDGFEVPAKGSPTSENTPPLRTPKPQDLSVSDLDGE